MSNDSPYLRYYLPTRVGSRTLTHLWVFTVSTLINNVIGWSPFFSHEGKLGIVDASRTVYPRVVYKELVCSDSLRMKTGIRGSRTRNGSTILLGRFCILVHRKDEVQELEVEWISFYRKFEQTLTVREGFGGLELCRLEWRMTGRGVSMVEKRQGPCTVRRDGGGRRGPRVNRTSEWRKTQTDLTVVESFL